MNEEMKNRIRKAPTHWTLRYRGMTLEAILTGEESACSMKPWWCGYVYIPIDKATKKDLAEGIWIEPAISEMAGGRSWYHYSKIPMIADVPAHGGVTYYHKHLGDGGRDPYPAELRYVCIGWDYNHLWDEDLNHTMEDVFANAMVVADYFIEKLGLPGKED